MKVTYSEIMGAHRAIQGLTQNGSVNVPALAALRLARAARVLAREAQAFEVGRVALIKQLAPDPDEQGNQTVLPEHMAEFNRQLAELAEQEVVIDVPMVALDDFGDCQLPLTYFFGMEWLIAAP